MNDRRMVAVQIGRPSRAEIETRARCHLSLPVAVRVPPVLEDGTPFPTLYWLTCPLAVLRVSRLESAGGVKAMDRRAEQAPGFGEALAAAHARYAAQREELTPPGAEHRPRGGVAGGVPRGEMPACPLRRHPGRQFQPGRGDGGALGGTARLCGPVRDRTGRAGGRQPGVAGPAVTDTAGDGYGRGPGHPQSLAGGPTMRGNRPGDGTGSRGGLKLRCPSRACGFESHPGHRRCRVAEALVMPPGF